MGRPLADAMNSLCNIYGGRSRSSTLYPVEKEEAGAQHDPGRPGSDSNGGHGDYDQELGVNGDGGGDAMPPCLVYIYDAADEYIGVPFDVCSSII